MLIIANTTYGMRVIGTVDKEPESPSDFVTMHWPFVLAERVEQGKVSVGMLPIIAAIPVSEMKLSVSSFVAVTSESSHRQMTNTYEGCVTKARAMSSGIITPGLKVVQ